LDRGTHKTLPDPTSPGGRKREAIQEAILKGGLRQRGVRFHELYRQLGWFCGRSTIYGCLKDLRPFLTRLPDGRYKTNPQGREWLAELLASPSPWEEEEPCSS